MMKRNYSGKYFDVNHGGIECTIEFKMEVSLDESLNFSGTVWEEEFSVTSGKLLTVKGFIDDDHISFVKTYPCFYGCDEEGKILIDKSKIGHEVIYDGYWDEKNGIWFGEWEVEGTTEISNFDEIETEVFIGKFEMKKFENSIIK